MIKGRTRENPPYRWMTQAKYDSLGERMTLKRALDKWWNAIYITFPDRFTISYKCSDGTYEVSELADELGLTEDEVLEVKIDISGEWDEDGDGYPVVYAELAEDK